jgi:hypothetical protein
MTGTRSSTFAKVHAALIAISQVLAADADTTGLRAYSDLPAKLAELSGRCGLETGH